MTPYDKVTDYFQKGTAEEVSFQQDGKVSGYVGMKRGEKVFYWNQNPLRKASTDSLTAYGMSTPLLEEIESLGVEKVYVSNEKETVPISWIQNAEVLYPHDDFFNNKPDYKQHVIKI